MEDELQASFLDVSMSESMMEESIQDSDKNEKCTRSPNDNRP